MTSANSLFDFSLMARDGAKGPDLKSLQLGHVSSRCMRSGRISTSPETDETRWRNVSDAGVRDPPGCKGDRPFILSPLPAGTEKPKASTGHRAKQLAHHLGSTSPSATGLPFTPLPAAPHLNFSVWEYSRKRHLPENTWAGSRASLVVEPPLREGEAWGDDGSRKSPSTSAQGRM